MPAGEPLTWAGSLCLVLYKERHIFRTSSPRASPFSDGHRASMAAASLTHGLSVTLALRAERQGPRNDSAATTVRSKFQTRKKSHSPSGMLVTNGTQDPEGSPFRGTSHGGGAHGGIGPRLPRSPGRWAQAGSLAYCLVDSEK